MAKTGSNGFVKRVVDVVFRVCKIQLVASNLDSK